MQTENEKEVLTQEEQWTWKDLFGREFFIGVWKKSYRFMRAAIMLGILFHFFSLGIVPSESMSPTLERDDFILYANTKNVDRGDIVYFVYPLDEKLMYVKRIIGMPGDEVEVRDGSVYVNGESLQEDYLLEKPLYKFEKVLVPQGHYFVLGDNRNNSEDSSHWGFLKEENVKGKALVLLLPITRLNIF
ncbi:signal peptidase I [Brevibacillus sp. NPDC058079]|uniref:signal peptidase I n=1 Tax=Brevibacillus sp. NPDC058079 TaxID=3346330 RepID=UPI0036F155F4